MLDTRKSSNSSVSQASSRTPASTREQYRPPGAVVTFPDGGRLPHSGLKVDIDCALVGANHQSVSDIWSPVVYDAAARLVLQRMGPALHEHKEIAMRLKGHG
jgi:hypothetical protein